MPNPRQYGTATGTQVHSIRRTPADPTAAITIPANSPEQGILLELDRMMVLWCISASFINSLVANPSLADDLASHATFTAKPLIYHSVAGFDPHLITTMPAAAAIAAFYRTLSLIKVRHTIYFSHASALTPQELHAMRAECRVVTLAALDVITALKVLDVRLTNHTALSDLSQMKQLLEAVDAGRSPCNDGAAVKLPTWTKGRRSARRWVGAEAHIRFAASWHTVIITDISEGGVGVRGAVALAVSDHVAIEFDTGRLMDGTVISKNDNKFGIKLVQRLPSSDPLLGH